MIECEFHKANGFCTEGTEHIKPLIRSGSTILNQREAGQNEDRHVFFLVLLYYYMYYLYGYLFSIFYVRQTCKYLCNLMLLSNSDIYLFHLSCYYLSHVIAAHGLRLLLWSSSEDLVVEPLELAFKPLNIFPLFCYIFGISLSDPLVL